MAPVLFLGNSNQYIVPNSLSQNHLNMPPLLSRLSSSASALFVLIYLYFPCDVTFRQLQADVVIWGEQGDGPRRRQGRPLGAAQPVAAQSNLPRGAPHGLQQLQPSARVEVWLPDRQVSSTLSDRQDPHPLYLFHHINYNPLSDRQVPQHQG